MAFKRTVLATAIAAGLALTSVSAHALTVSFYNGSNLYASMTTSNSTDFDLFFNGEGVAAGSFIDYINLAGPDGTFTNTSTQTVASTAGWDSDGFTDAGETFNWQIQFPNANDLTRLTVGEHGLWSIVTTDPSVWTFNMVHINAFDANGNSIKLVGCIDGTEGCTSVPEPASLALLGLGLVGLGLARRRRA